MGRNKFGTFGRPVEECNRPVERFEEFCVRQYLRIKDGVERHHEKPFVRRADNQFGESTAEEVEPEEFAFTSPQRDPDLYTVEIRK